MEINNNFDYNKYYRKQPIKEFKLNQTMYSLIHNESINNMKLDAVGFLKNNMTYQELFVSADKLAQALHNIGVKEGSSVAILTISMPIVQQSMLALSKIGATMSWIDLRSKPKDIVKYINNSECKVLIIFEDMIKEIEPILDKTDVKKVIVSSFKDYVSPITRTLATINEKNKGNTYPFPKDSRFIKFNDFIKNIDTNNLIMPIAYEKDRPSLIVQSSGSTGKPKQIVHTEYNFNSAIQKMAYTDLPFYKGKTMHISIPPFIIYGLGNSVYASMAFTMKAEMNPLVSEDTVYNDLGKFDISLAAPLHYRYIYKKITELNNSINELMTDNSKEAKKELNKKLKELKNVLKGLERAKVLVSGGDKIGASEVLEMQQTFNRPIINGYGNNECLGATIVSPMYANKPGSIGIPMNGIEIKIVNPDNGKTLSQGEIGELYISSDNLFVEYLNNSKETTKIKEISLAGKEWVKTGDLCYIDDDGYIIPKGRNRRLIKKEAFKISPDTIEEVISSLSYVEECVVVGIDDEKMGAVPMAFIVLKDKTLSLNDVYEEIYSKCIDELPDYEIPTYFEQIEKIPYTPNDKQDFRLLESIGNDIIKNKKCKKLVNKI